MSDTEIINKFHTLTYKDRLKLEKEYKQFTQHYCLDENFINTLMFLTFKIDDLKGE